MGRRVKTRNTLNYREQSDAYEGRGGSIGDRDWGGHLSSWAQDVVYRTVDLLYCALETSMTLYVTGIQIKIKKQSSLKSCIYTRE